jgi:exo-beta-1,3-glucanase (GH17 family)
MQCPRFTFSHSFALVSCLTAAIAAAGCFSNNPPPAGGAGGGNAGSSGGAGSTGAAGAAAGSTGAAGSSSGAAGDTSGGAGSTGAAGAAAGSSGAAGDASGGAGSTGAAGSGGATGAAGVGGMGGAGGITITGLGGGGVAGGPPAFSTKPLSVIAYSPYRDGQAPGGANQPTMAQVKADLMMLQPYVQGIRVYGTTDVAQGYIPALCDSLGIDLYLGAWIDGIASDEPNVHALATIVNQNHPSIKVAIVGNEVLNRSKKNGVTEDRMVQLVNLFRADLKVTGVKVAEADTYPQWMMNLTKLSAAVDLIIWHTYAYWSGIDISNAAAVVNGRYNDMLAMYPGKPMVLGETGWPTMVDHVSTNMTTTAVASEANQARYYREALANFRTRNLPAWMFDAIDESWKATDGEGPVGSHWGIFTTARAPKQAATELMMMVK